MITLKVKFLRRLNGCDCSCNLTSCPRRHCAHGAGAVSRSLSIIFRQINDWDHLKVFASFFCWEMLVLYDVVSEVRSGCRIWMGLLANV